MVTDFTQNLLNSIPQKALRLLFEACYSQTESTPPTSATFNFKGAELQYSSTGGRFQIGEHVFTWIGNAFKNEHKTFVNTDQLHDIEHNLNYFTSVEIAAYALIEEFAFPRSETL